MALIEADRIWMNGALVPWADAKVHVLSNGLHYGTGVLEGTRAHATPRGPAVFRLDDHLRRFRESAHILGFEPPYDSAALRAATLELIAANGHDECYLRHLAHLGYGEMGPGFHPGLPVEVSIAGWEWHTYLGDGAERGIRLATSSWRRNDPNAMPPAAKATAGYLNSALAKTAALRAGYDDALLLNADGYVGECSAANVFAIREGVLCTPPPSAGALRGITQDTVLTLARDLGIEVRVRNLLRTDLYTAEEVFVTGTAAGVIPVASLDDREVGSGPITRKLRAAYTAAVTGRDERYEHWLTLVDQ
ncbi:branched-chain amino acid transaminase [Embleya hyalina]|uniref:Branched-chain-amino-acid aminotransferase n=1 Tax=Embleya hyalina TaxID=516124 RepID=A0A401YU67_9ACTN|nr:branched-chain amino acid transaminase [Embleya hyalina]GCD98137.1 4-amino-4-deoxychorismate lyase [Embleya hyalina]